MRAPYLLLTDTVNITVLQSDGNYSIYQEVLDHKITRLQDHTTCQRTALAKLGMRVWARRIVYGTMHWGGSMSSRQESNVRMLQ
jgi:hypothetical protein